ncbi:M23 family metallopeptidase [Paenibacillus sp.]|uniref:M23 family metallopeptidase n=1 Tax=Paenibacillus sp. TaxID=58172 RepID=UPI002D2C4615|nr:peptidoglycan DD-metalloendopeptidase family protein [Paenibacillus sp.]HZG55668.1 peptidoglycan DD-metalloendopeptidase family protein [Paenibacillus sp.]
MIPERFTKKLTFLIIPEANRQVRRLRVPVALLYAVPCMTAALAIAAASLAATQSAALQETGALQAERAAQAAAHAQAVESKDAEIARLQDELVRLSQQAETFAEKMAELESLEREILSLTEEDGGVSRPTAEAAPNEPAAMATASAADPAGARVMTLSAEAGAPGVGGQYVPVDTEAALRLSETTQHSFEAMSLEADRLEGALQQALQEAEKLAYLRRITPSIYPTTSTQITSLFGYRRDPFTRRTAYHRGIDFGGSKGDPIFATADGSVTATGYDRAMGNYIYLKHGNGLETVYMHLSKTLVKKGQNVKKGEKIGTLGSTGRSTGPHLHYEVHKNGEPVNPKPYIQHQEG